IYNMLGGINSWKTKGYPTTSEGFLDIEVEEAWELLNDTNNGIQKPIDVRTYEEWIDEHIDTPPPENASHYPLSDLQDPEKLPEFMESFKGMEIIFYSNSGDLSLIAAGILVDNSFEGTIYNMLGGINAWKVAGYPIVGGEPLIADADGPYEAFEDEPIQFEGSADGGEPPYSFHWDFGNGDTLDEEDPVYAYDEPGVYEVILTVTDDAENTDDDDTTATINEMPCCFEVLIPPGFGIGLKAEVTEICEESHTGVPWEFKITGGLIVIPISPLTGTADFAAGETKTIKVPLVIGLGSIQITFTIGEYCDPTIVNARIIGPFVIVS
ncbi:MAG: PKD domain-containing protein, partial [Thermoplasmatales archaeon]|nr:PKD domain-containing protein [Thermoplasmatales archaeon]